MRHFLAYGNSDQASFRNADVRDAFDFMTVPGTIASYYADATAAFVLTADIPYLIDPRTPLFQDTIHSPRASHYSLADWLDIDLDQAVYQSAGRTAADFPSGFYDDEQLERTVARVLDLQFTYGGRSGVIQAKLDRYRSLMQEALGQAENQEPAQDVRHPDLFLAPYYMSDGAADPWWDVNQRIWDLCVNHPRVTAISPVVAVTNVQFLGEAMAQTPTALAERRFFWISAFDERKVDADQLSELAAAVSTADPYLWTNLYGGFFSIALGSVGLWGFSNGLGYSESRAWPQLEATGGAPPRYYIPRLHTFTSVANAQLLLQLEPWLFEPVVAHRTSNQPIPTLSYHELKRDFALARRWELQQAHGAQPNDIAQALEVERDRYLAIERQLPSRLRIDTGYLTRWVDVLRGY